MRSREHVEEDIELIILVNSVRVVGEKLLKEASQSFVKIGKDELSFLEKRILLNMVSWKAVEKKEEVESFNKMI